MLWGIFQTKVGSKVRKVQENQTGLKLYRTHRLLICADDMNILGDNITTTNKNTAALIDSSKEIIPEVNREN